MIRNIIFDLAGVLMNLDIEKDTYALKCVGLPTYAECLKRPEIEQPMSAYLNGLINQHEFLKRIRPFCHQGLTDREILWSMDAVLDEIPFKRLQLVASLHKQYHTYLLSNLYDTAWQYTLFDIHHKGFELDELFHKVYLSQQLHLAKPDPAIFNHVINDAPINPADTIFFDDTKANVEAARQLGLQAVLVPMNQLEDVLTQALG